MSHVNHKHDSLGLEQRDAVLIITDDPVHAREVERELVRLGYRISTSVYDGDRLDDTPNNPPKVVLFIFHDYMSAIPLIVDSLKQDYSDPDLTIIGALSHKSSVDISIFDSAIFPPSHPTQIAGRVNSMVRLQRMQREISLRLETLQDDFGIEYTMDAPVFDRAFRVLFIGKASPEFMVVINALESHKVETVAAFTSFSAFDFLHEVNFDAVVMNMQDGLEPALTITETMRRNSRLYHVPALFLVGKEFEDHDKAYVKGATDVIPFGAEQAEIAGRILELANYYRLHSRLNDEFSAMGGEKCSDPASGAYNRYFTIAHLKRIGQSNADTEHSTSLMMIKAKPQDISIPEDKLKAGLDRLGQMIGNMVRMEDLVSRFSDDTYMVTFPGQMASRMKPVQDRIEAVIENAVFERSDHARDHFSISVDVFMHELHPSDDCNKTIRDLIAMTKRDVTETRAAS